MKRRSQRFTRAADRVTAALGTPQALLLSVLLVVVWALSGPWFDWSDTWQLLINTTTTVITFWMVFVIQASQNRSDKATHVKLDEILKWMAARQTNEAIGLEKSSDEEIDALSRRVRQSRETGV